MLLFQSNVSITSVRMSFQSENFDNERKVCLLSCKLQFVNLRKKNKDNFFERREMAMTRHLYRKAQIQQV